MGSVDVAKSELVKTLGETRHICVDRREGKKNSPGYEPDGQHDANHHAQETDEKIAVEPVVFLDLAIVR